MADPEGFYFPLTAAGRPPHATIDERRVPDYQWYNGHRASSRSGNPINKVTTVVIHATSGYATQHALDNWRAREASAHWIVPDEDEPQHGQFVWAVVDESLAAWHVKGSVSHPDLGNRLHVNSYSLGIEIVNTQDVQNFSDPYSDWQIAVTARIVRYCWSKYPNLAHVISHARIDPSRRSDPGRNFPWDRFRASVLTPPAEAVPEAVAMSILPVSAFPYIDPAKGGGCCP